MEPLFGTMFDFNGDGRTSHFEGFLGLTMLSQIESDDQQKRSGELWSSDESDDSDDT